MVDTLTDEGNADGEEGGEDDGVDNGDGKVEVKEDEEETVVGNLLASLKQVCVKRGVTRCVLISCSTPLSSPRPIAM